MKAPRILRIFVARTNLTPTDPLAVVGPPLLWRPAPEAVDALHISCVFSWQKRAAENLRELWAPLYPGKPIKTGGPAYDAPAGPFVGGRYVRWGMTITTRGCPNNCPFCFVPRREGRRLETLEICPGHLVQDNNILAAPRPHFAAVCKMLTAYHNDHAYKRHPAGSLPYNGANFRGGLDATRLTDWHIEKLRALPAIKELWLAYDHASALNPLKAALKRLAWLPPRKRRVYVLAGYDPADTPEKTTARLYEVLELGALPYPQLYEPAGDARANYRGDRRAWRELARLWSVVPYVVGRAKTIGVPGL